MLAVSSVTALPDPGSPCCCVRRGWCMESIWPRLPWWLVSGWVQPPGEALADVMLAGGDTRQGISLLLSSCLGNVSGASCISPWPQCLGNTCAPWPLVPETGQAPAIPSPWGVATFPHFLTPAHTSTGLPLILFVWTTWAGYLYPDWCILEVRLPLERSWGKDWVQVDLGTILVGSSGQIWEGKTPN